MKKKRITLISVIIALALLAILVTPALGYRADNTTCYKYWVTRNGRRVLDHVCQVSRRSSGGSNPPAPTARPPQPTARPRQNDPDPEPEEVAAPPPCTPTYNPPTIAFGGRTPANPIVIGQDPDRIGVDFVITATGGRRSNDCNQGPDQRTITFLDVSTIHLSPEAIARINGELAAAYPGATVLDNYPIFPTQYLQVFRQQHLQQSRRRLLAFVTLFGPTKGQVRITVINLEARRWVSCRTALRSNSLHWIETIRNMWSISTGSIFKLIIKRAGWHRI